MKENIVKIENLGPIELSAQEADMLNALTAFGRTADTTLEDAISHALSWGLLSLRFEDSCFDGFYDCWRAYKERGGNMEEYKKYLKNS